MRRVAHGTLQAMQAQTVKLGAGEERTPGGPLPTPPILPATQARHYEGIHLIEHPVGIARPEIPPAAKHGRQCRDKLLHLFPALLLAGKLSDSFPEFLRRLRAWPPLHEMPAGIALDAPLLANRASQEYEALLAAS